MESTEELERPLSLESDMSTCSIETPQSNITTFMAEKRTISQVLKAIAITDSFYHLVYMLTLFFSSTVLWTHLQLYSRPEKVIHDIHSNLENVLRAEVGAFFCVFVIRQIFDTYNAVKVDQTWTRIEEPGQIRFLAFFILILNAVVTSFFIFWPVLSSKDGGST